MTAEVKVHHYAIIELLDDDTALQEEQEILDDIAHLTDRLEKLLATCSSTDSNTTKIAAKRLKHLDKDNITIFDAISSPLGADAVCLLQQYTRSN